MVRRATRAITLVAISLLFSMAYATEKHPPKHPPKPPPKTEMSQLQKQQMEQEQYQKQLQEQKAYGGDGGHGGDGGSVGDVDVSAVSDSQSQALATNEGVDVNASDTLAISNVYMSRAFAQDFPITHGCFVGINGGGDKTTQTKSTGGFLGFTYLSNSCHMQKLAAVEKDVDIVARLQCGDRKYRKAVAFDAPKGTSKREHCINIKKQSLMGAIELERKQLEELAQQYKSERDDAVILYEEQKRYADKVTGEVQEKRFIEAVSK